MKLTTLFLVVSSLLTGPIYAETGVATFYTEKSCQREGNSGKLTASGEVFNEEAMTCARRSREWGKEWLVYSHETGQSIVVRQNDFGPGKGPTKNGVIIDLSPRAFKALGGELKNGKINVSVQEIK